MFEPKQLEYKIFFQCQCCFIKTGRPSIDFETTDELRAHLAVNHFQNFLLNEIKTNIKQYPYCPFQNCDFLAEKMATVMEHFNLVHKPEVCDFDSVTEILCRKCSKCSLGPFESQDDLLTHIGMAHGEMIEVWITKRALIKTLDPLKKVI